MSSPVMRVQVATPGPPERKRRSVLVPVLAASLGALVLGSVVGVILDRVTDPDLTITVDAAQKVVESVLQNDYGLTDASSTTCEKPESSEGAVFDCTAQTGAVTSGQVTVTVTVLNRAGQLSVGAPHE